MGELAGKLAAFAQQQEDIIQGFKEQHALLEELNTQFEVHLQQHKSDAEHRDELEERQAREQEGRRWRVQMWAMLSGALSAVGIFVATKWLHL